MYYEYAWCWHLKELGEGYVWALCYFCIFSISFKLFQNKKQRKKNPEVGSSRCVIVIQEHCQRPKNFFLLFHYIIFPCSFFSSRLICMMDILHCTWDRYISIHFCSCLDIKVQEEFLFLPSSHFRLKSLWAWVPLPMFLVKAVLGTSLLKLWL